MTRTESGGSPVLPVSIMWPDRLGLALMRSLFAFGPDDAEVHWAATTCLNQHRIPEAHWYRATDEDGETAYYFFDGLKGGFQRAVPSATDLAAASLVDVPAPGARPDLTVEFAHVLSLLPDGDPLRERSSVLLGALADMRLSGRPLYALDDFRRRYVSACVRHRRDLPPILSSMVDPSPDIASPEDVAAATAQLARDAYRSCMIANTPASRLLLVCAALAAIPDPAPVLVMNLHMMPPDGIMTGFLKGLLATAGGPERAVAAWEALGEEGSVSVRQAHAIGAADADGFFEKLYESVQLFEAAFLGFKFLAGRPELGEPLRRRVELDRNRFDEETVLSSSALQNEVLNAIDSGPIRHHRARIEKARADGGGDERRLMRYYHKVQRFYPMLWTEALAGKSDALPRRAAP